MRPATERTLSGKHILVTRPAEQAARLAALIAAAGGMSTIFPVIDIRDPANPEKLAKQIAGLRNIDLAIFISPTAVTRVFRHIHAWPPTLQAAAIGQGSAQALQRAGIQHILVSDSNNDSEALLSMPEMQHAAGKRVIVFRGEGGRELLADTLRQRGAEVEYAECYRRAMPDADVAPLLQAHAHHPFDAVILTSREGLDNFRKLLGANWDLFKSIPFVVPHPRIAEAARAVGVKHAVVSESGDAGCMDAIAKLFMV